MNMNLIYHLCVALVTMACYVLAGSVRVDLGNKGLTSVDWSLIPKDCTTLVLSNNHLTHVFVPTGYNSLETLYMRNNSIKSFPDLRNVKSTLKKLSFMYNSIKSIKPPRLLQQLVKLEWLLLGNNHIASLPDLAPLSKLKTLGIKYLPLTTLPNMCLMDPASRRGGLTVNAGDNNFSCASSTAWTKLAISFGLVTDSSMIDCTMPGNKEVVSLSDLLLEQLTMRDTMSIYRLMDSEKLYCYPWIISVNANVNLTECAVQCHQNPLCMVYATDDGQCVLTEYKTDNPGNSDIFDGYQSWWMFE